MNIKISIKTPKGQASKTNERIKPMLLGRKWLVAFDKSKSFNTYVNEEDNEIIWDIEAPVKDCLRIQKNVSTFDALVSGVMENRLVKKAIHKNTDEAGEAELKDMLQNQTSCEVIKKATQEEMDEYNKTWWQRVKEKFRKQD